MRRLRVLFLSIALLVGAMPPAAHAGAGTDVALGLASFAVFNQVFSPLFAPRGYAAPVVVTQPVIYYSYPTVYTAVPVYAVPAQVLAVPAAPAVVQYPHGRYELRGDGVTTLYFWVWIPNPPPPPPPPASQPSGQ